MRKRGLLQFFSFFGSKVALAKNYPQPKYDAIVEPFAGSAGYSCLCASGTTALVTLCRPDYRGCSVAAVHSCIAPIVQALNDSGIATVASCCGHGERLGTIALQDGRELIVTPDFESARRLLKDVAT